MHHHDLRLATDLRVNRDGKDEAVILLVAEREVLFPEPLDVVRVDESGPGDGFWLEGRPVFWFWAPVSACEQHFSRLTLPSKCHEAHISTILEGWILLMGFIHSDASAAL